MRKGKLFGTKNVKYFQMKLFRRTRVVEQVFILTEKSFPRKCSHKTRGTWRGGTFSETNNVKSFQRKTFSGQWKFSRTMEYFEKNI